MQSTIATSPYLWEGRGGGTTTRGGSTDTRHSKSHLPAFRVRVKVDGIVLSLLRYRLECTKTAAMYHPG